MTDSSGPPESPSTPVASAETEVAVRTILGRLRALRWRDGAIQFVIIVVGVLAALSADAIRQDFADRRREAGYVADLQRDMTTMLSIVDKVLRADSFYLARSDSMLIFLATTDHYADSTVRRWRGVAAGGFVPVQGTLRALIATGDLRIMRSSAMRGSVTAFLTDLDYAERQLDLASVDIEAANVAIRGREEVHTRWPDRLADTSAAGYVRYILDTPAMRADPALRAAYFVGRARLRTHIQRLIGFRVSVTGLQKVLVAEGKR